MVILQEFTLILGSIPPNLQEKCAFFHYFGSQSDPKLEMNTVFCFLEQTSSADLASYGAKKILKPFFTANSGEICWSHHGARQNLYEDPSNDHDFCKMRLFHRFRKHTAYHFEQLNSWNCSSYARKHINWSNENFQTTPTPSRTQYHDRFSHSETTLGASFIILNISKVNYLQNSSISV